MEMSNPTFGVSISPSLKIWRFSWAIHPTYAHASICTSVFIQERVGQSPGRAKVPWARHCASVQQQPLAHRIYDLGKLDLGCADGELKYMWLKRPKIGRGSLWRTELNSCQIKSVGLQTGQHALSTAAFPQRELYLTQKSSFGKSPC